MIIMKDKLIYIKRIIAAVCIMIFFAGIWAGLGYIVNDDTASYTRVMMHEFYSQENIDILFCGASLCYRSFDTSILDEELGLNTFNTGSSSQDLDVTYYLIKEAVSRYKIKQVVLELSPIMTMNMDIDSRTSSDMTNVYIISDYMKWSPLKVRLLLSSSSSDLYINSFSIARRNWQKIKDIDYICNLLKIKDTSAYREYRYDLLQHGSEWYAGKGYVANNLQVSEGGFADLYGTRQIIIDQINDEWYEYLNEIIDYCKNNGVELILTCAPLSDYLLSCYGDKYNDYHDLISRISENANIEFWDFSFCKKQYLPLNASNYCDSAHLNMYGAEIFSKLVAEILLGEKSVDEICFDNVEEKLQEDEPAVLGLVSTGDGFRIVSNWADTLEYRIEICPTDGVAYELQDFDLNGEIHLNQGETGTIHIMSRTIDNPDEVSDYYFSY